MRFTEISWFSEVRVNFDLIDGPDLTPNYGTQVFHAEHAKAILQRRSIDGADWRLSQVTVSGHRRLKAGGLGTQVCDTEFGGWRGDLPDWLEPVAAAAFDRANNPQSTA